jgi:hypothetical protein
MAATIELYANNAYSILANSISDSVTTINIAPGTGSRFPSPTGNQFFRLTITGAASPNSSIEIVYVTSRSTDALTVIRGREGTTAQSWSVNDLCANEPTAEMLKQFMQPYFAIDEGVADAYVVNTQQNQTTYYSGMPVVFSTPNANVTATPTLNLNGIGARVIKNASGGALVAGEIRALTPIEVLYSPVDSAWLMQSPIGYQRTITGAASTIVSSDLTAQRALISSPSGKVSASGITATELSYLFGATSSIQDQINARARYTDFIYQAGLYNATYNTYNNGYMIFPGGFKIVWIEMRTFTTSAGGALVTLPSAFTTSAACWQATSANGGGNPTAVGIGPNSTLSVADVRWAANTIGAFIVVMGV